MDVVIDLKSNAINVSCGDVIMGSVNQSTNYYQFNIYDTDAYDVRFDDCYSDADVALVVTNSNGVDISNEYCDGGDWCGSCKNAGNWIYGENFTIPMMQNGIYYIGIVPISFGSTGSYEVQIHCNLISTFFTTESSVTSVTSVHDRMVYECGATFLATQNNEVYILNLSNVQHVFIDACYDKAADIKCYDLYFYDSNDWKIEMYEYDNDCRCHQILSNISGDIYTLQIDSYTESTNYTVSIGCGINECDRCVQEISCNTTYEGTLDEDRNIVYYYFDYVNHDQSTVIFDSCGSAGDTYLYLYDIDMNLLFEADDDGLCGTRSQMKLNALSTGKYIFGISTFKPERDRTELSWQIEVLCGFNISVSADIDASPYIAKHFGRDDTSWPTAETFCENTYGSTLSTIISQQDKNDSLQLIVPILSWLSSLHLSWLRQLKYRVWIGLMKYNNSEPQWVSGAPWNGTTVSMICDDYQSEFAVVDDRRNINLFGAYLYIVMNSNSSGTIESVSICFTDFTTQFSDFSMALCNNADGRHKVANCSESTHCWFQMDCCNTSSSRFSSIAPHEMQDVWQPPIALWNETLFLLGHSSVVYTKIDLFANTFEWKQLLYDADGIGGEYMISQKFAQYQSSLYLLREKYSDYSYVLMHIDLDTLQITLHDVPSEYYWSDWGDNWWNFWQRGEFCMVVDDKSVYIFRPQFIIIFDINNYDWNTVNFANMVPEACAITNDYRYIYTFGDISDIANPIYKFDTKTHVVTQLEKPSICDALAISVTAGNDKVYMSGCGISSLQTQIFDVETERFEANTVNIDNPKSEYMSYYKRLRPVWYDVNVLLGVHAFDYDGSSTFSKYIKYNSIFIYYMITDLVAITFSLVLSDEAVWPSEGVQMSYDVNDFDLQTDWNYQLVANCNDTTDDIHEQIVLNANTNNCKCDKHIYNCYDCTFHFELANYLSVIDNDIYRLNVAISSNSEHILVRPHFITLNLQRCVITFTDLNQTATSHRPFIHFSFNISPNCFSRTNKLNIIVSEVGIAKQLIIAMDVCAICDVGDDICESCHNNEFVLGFETNGLDDTDLHILFNSQDINLQSIPTSTTIQYFDKLTVDPHFPLVTVLGIILPFLFITFCIVIILIIWYWRKRQKYLDAFFVDKAWILIIPIGVFDDMSSLSVRPNVNNLKALWGDRYNYIVNILNEQRLYTTKRNIFDALDNVQAQTFLGVKCIMLHIISHADEQNISCSDGKKVNKDYFVHELCDKVDELKQDILIIVWFHTCNGGSIYSSGSGRNRTTDNESTQLHTTSDDSKAKLALLSNKSALQAKKEEDKSDDKSFSSSNINAFPERNCVKIEANWPGWALSDDGHFTNSIVKVFVDNLKKFHKDSWSKLIQDIRSNLQELSQNTELCTPIGSFSFDVRFVPSQNQTNETKTKTASETDIELVPLKEHGRDQQIVECEE